MNTYKITARFIDAMLCKYEEDDTIKAPNIQTALELAEDELKSGEFASDYVEIIKIEKVKED